MLEKFFRKTQYITLPQARPEATGEEEGGSVRCPLCLQPNHGEKICPTCGGHRRIGRWERLDQIADEGTFEPFAIGSVQADPLGFPGYRDKLETVREKTGDQEAATAGRCTIGGRPAAVGIMDASFLMGSLGSEVGEILCTLFERATEEKLPVILFSASGGARMQEGILSLMQMARVTAALERHHRAGGFFLSVLTDPTTGGVTASFAMLGDLILAEPGALIGFAGPRVIEETIRQKLPEGFQRAEFLLEKGFVDAIVPRREMKATLVRLIDYHRPEEVGAWTR
jgi:acetyl-CoA carboxylase carboxyl transferase subunit beta